METTAWEPLRASLVRFVRSRVREREAAEDIVHDVLVRALAREASLRDREKLGQWLFRMTSNAIVDHYRARRPSVELPDELPADTPESASAERELAQCLGGFLAQLPDRYRSAIELAELEGLTQHETADRLGISLSGAKSRVQRGRAKLEELIRECCRVELDRRGAVIDYDRKAGCGDGSGCA